MYTPTDFAATPPVLRTASGLNRSASGTGRTGHYYQERIGLRKKKNRQNDIALDGYTRIIAPARDLAAETLNLERAR